MEIIVYGKPWTVVKVYEKKQRERDLFLCKNRYGIKECFQRCEFAGYEHAPRRRKGDLSEEDKLKIEEEVKNKRSRDEIYRMFPHASTHKILLEIQKARKKFGYTYKDNSRGGKMGKPVVQYDLDGNFIARYDSVYAAAKALGTSDNAVLYAIKNRRKLGGFIWRREDDQFERKG